MTPDSQTHTSLLDGLHDRNNQNAWRRMVQRYQPMLYGFARRVGLSDDDAHELVAETLAVAVKGVPEGAYDRSKGRLRDWLRGILRNQYRRLLQRRGVEAAHSEPAALATAGAATENSVDTAYDREWRLELLDQALELLRRESDIEQFQAFDLLARRDWKASEVAKLLGATRGAVYVAKHRMLKRLREIMFGLENSGPGTQS